MRVAVEPSSEGMGRTQPRQDLLPIRLALSMPSVGETTPPGRNRAASRRLTQIVFAATPDAGRAEAVAVVGRAPLDDAGLPAFIADLLDDARCLAWPHRTSPLDDATLERFMRGAARANVDDVAARVAAFEALLDPARLAACPPDRPLRYQAYNWLGTLDAIACRRFVEATVAYPFLWTLLFAKGELSTTAAGIALRACIADAEPLAPTLCQTLAAAPWQVRALQRGFVAGALTTRDLGTAGELMTLVRALDHLPPEHVPATRPGWLYLVRAAETTVHKAWVRGLGAVGLDRLASGREVPRAWRRFARLAGLRRTLSDLRDLYAYAADFGERVWLPAEHETDLRAVVEAHDRWKAVIDPLGTSTAPVAPHLKGRWTPLLAEPLTVAGHAFHDLPSVDALREDGFLMKHCVGSYGQLCEEKGSRIFSVRDADGRRVSTVQVHFLKGAWRVLQHRGKTNTNPPAAAHRAAAAFADMLNVLEAIRPLPHGPATEAAPIACGASSPAPVDAHGASTATTAAVSIRAASV